MKAVALPPDNRLRGSLAAQFDRVPASWGAVTEPFRDGVAGRALCQFVDERVDARAPVYPATVFRALELTPADAVRVVILGQDPYHGAGQAQGLAFSVAPGAKPPPSLRNMLKEVAADTGRPSPCNGDLSPWAAQGVLLLNSVLTVEDGRPQAHAHRGWEALTDALLAHVAALRPHIAFLLWGAAAQRKRDLVEDAGGGHLVLAANHPSPLSALRPPTPFIGCGHFGAANRFLAVHEPQRAPIHW